MSGTATHGNAIEVIVLPCAVDHGTTTVIASTITCTRSTSPSPCTTRRAVREPPRPSDPGDSIAAQPTTRSPTPAVSAKTGGISPSAARANRKTPKVARKPSSARASPSSIAPNASRVGT